MTLGEFIENYDKPASVVLLEGKRTVKEEDQEKLIALGKLLAEKTTNITFRSGNADGSDFFFSKGVSAVSNRRLEVITPYSGHRKQANRAYKTFALDELKIASESDIVYQSKTNKKMVNLIDQYVSGDINPKSIKAAYILRDTVKVIGSSEIKPATFAIFYDDTENPDKGGTGHTINICRRNNIPFIKQETWFKWLENEFPENQVQNQLQQNQRPGYKIL